MASFYLVCQACLLCNFKHSVIVSSVVICILYDFIIDCVQYSWLIRFIYLFFPDHLNSVVTKRNSKTKQGTSITNK